MALRALREQGVDLSVIFSAAHSVIHPAAAW
jgi:hypothetical protein